MESINPEINALFKAYCTVMEMTMPLTISHERMCFDALKDGITPEGLTICIEARKKFNRENNCKKSLLLHKLFRDEEDRAIVINEIAEEQSKRRIKTMNPAKASVLRATGRSDTLPEAPAQAVANSELLNALRKAAS